jgi:transposase
MTYLESTVSTKLQRIYRDKAWLKEKYEQEKFLVKEIADMCNVSKPTIYKWLNKFGLKEITQRYGAATKNGGSKTRKKEKKAKRANWSLKKELFTDPSNFFQFIVKKRNISVSAALVEKFRHEMTQIKKKLPWSSRYRHIRIAGPIFSYVFLKAHSFNIESQAIRDLFNIDRRTFREGLKRVLKHYPKYWERDRVTLIQKRILKCKEHFQFGREFLKICEILFRAYYPYIQFNSEILCASVISSLAVLILNKKNPNLEKVATFMGSRSSSVFLSIKRNIFEKRGKRGFCSLKKQRKMIINDLANLGEIPQNLMENLDTRKKEE